MNIIKNGSGNFNSIYSFFSEISSIREFKKPEILENITLKISKLVDSNIIIHEDIFKRRDDESLKIF
ncbi:MAG: hypothetical protein ACFFG0_48415 [Candidatus Thorarchaeota archaeon]